MDNQIQKNFNTICKKKDKKFQLFRSYHQTSDKLRRKQQQRAYVDGLMLYYVVGV